MPRVVPSQVVAFIDTIPLTDDPSNPLPVDTAEVSGLADLLDQIPEELLTMDADTYASFICSKARIRDTLSAWTGGWGTERLLLIQQADAIRGIRYALAQCPDESPAPGTSELSFIADPDLRTNLRNDIGAINRALSSGEWKAATVLAGSTIEALLLWALQRNPAAAIAAATTLVTAATLSRQPDANLERWDLHEYTEVAANLGTIEPGTATETRLAREFRNLIHPGRAQRLGQTCDRGTALSCVAALDHVVRDLTP